MSPKIAVCCLMFNEAGKAVAIEHPKGLTVPGGKVNPGETDEQAVRRECMEELGITLGPTLIHLGDIPTGEWRTAWYLAPHWEAAGATQAPEFSPVFVDFERLMQPGARCHEFTGAFFKGQAALQRVRNPPPSPPPAQCSGTPGRAPGTWRRAPTAPRRAQPPPCRARGECSRCQVVGTGMWRPGLLRA